MKVIAEMLADDEPFFGGVSGICGKGILAATDRRLIFASRGCLWGGDMVEEFSYAHIDILKYRTEMLRGEISIGKGVIDYVDKRLVPGFVRGVQVAMSGGTPEVQWTPSSVPEKSETKRNWPKIALIGVAVLFGLYILGSVQKTEDVPAPAETALVAPPGRLGVRMGSLFRHEDARWGVFAPLFAVWSNRIKN